VCAVIRTMYHFHDSLVRQMLIRQGAAFAHFDVAGPQIQRY
jgi:hypothetical protein